MNARARGLPAPDVGQLGDILAAGRRDRRGPRYAAYWAAIDVLSEAQSSLQSSLPVKTLGGMLPRAPASEVVSKARAGMTAAKAEGVIREVKAGAASLTLTFTTESWQESVMDCKETDKIDRIEPDGQVIYRQQCRVTGERTVTRTEQPVEVPVAFGGGLEPGQLVRLFVDAGRSGRRGIPMETYADKQRKHLIGFAGIAL